MTDAATSKGSYRVARVLTGALLAAIWGPPCAYAIPSPELVVSSISSLTQLWGLAGAAAGGALLIGGKAGATNASQRGLMRLLWAVCLLAMGAIALNAVQYFAARNARAAHLESTLIRPSPKSAGGATLDSHLVEMPYSTQIESPMGVSTDQVAAVLPDIAAGKRPDIVALDIRESVETETGGMPGARTIRFPDLVQTAIDFTGKTALLFCHNGNRSGETCAALAARGINCRFMVGGMEKWLVEGRTLSGTTARTLADLRAIASYRNQSVLLETDDVKRLLASEHAVSVDVRYPGEFEAGHLPGAINLPIRPTPTAELEKRLDALPDAPIFAPCYDRRSCFFADVLGLELSRRGRDFRGRYSVPWEYFQPVPPPPHVTQWLESANRSVFSRAAGALAGYLERVARHTGLVPAILLLALASRLIVAPFAAKADRDQRVARAIAPQVAALKARLSGDPQRHSRALRLLMRRHGMTPGRNLAALLFLPLLAVSIEAVTRVSARAPGDVGWIPDLAAPDPLHVLPLAFGLLIAIYLHMSFGETRAKCMAVWAIAWPLFTYIPLAMPSGAALYMVASAALLMLQRGLSSLRFAAVGALGRRIRLGWRRWRLGDHRLVTLGDTDRLEPCGNKAYRLGLLGAIGVRVPRGIVVTAAFLARLEQSDPSWSHRKLNRIWRQLGARRVAVRSSAGSEDSSAHSFAGVFTTVLDVNRNGLAGAIDRVAASFENPDTRSYSAGAGLANILIQPMVAARYAGVLFTEGPAAPGSALIEWVKGTGDDLVSGRVSPGQIRVGRTSSEVTSAGPVPFDATHLASIGRRIEARFGRPQDIEWAHDGRRFVILQSRDIVGAPNSAEARSAAEWRKLAQIAATGFAHQQQRREPTTNPDTPILVQDSMSELLPRPTPASLSLLGEFWSPGGSMDLAARSLGFSAPGFDGEAPDAPPLYVTAFGSLYTDARVKASRSFTLSSIGARRLRGLAGTIEDQIRGEVLPSICVRARRLEALDPERLSTADLVALFVETRLQLVSGTHVHVDSVNIAAQFYMDDAQRAVTRANLDPLVVLGAGPSTRLTKGLRGLPRLAPQERLGALYHLLGHRAAIDYELSAPRHGETRESLTRAAELLALASGTGHADCELAALPPRLRAIVERARRFVCLKEDAKHEALREVAGLRRLILALDQRFALGGNVFFLTLEETASLSVRTRATLYRTASTRRSDHELLVSPPSLGMTLTLRQIERGPLPALATPRRAIAEAGVMTGTRVSGSAAVEGRAICVPAGILEAGYPIPGFQTGDIIVSRAMHPSWLPELMACGGVAVEVGGWLSHMAILARERGLAMSVGMRGLDQIRTGMRVRLDPDGGLVRL